MKFAAFLMLCVAALGGCKTFAGMSDEELASTIYRDSKLAARAGLKIALEKAPASDADIRTNAKLAIKLVRENVVPLFSSPTEDVLRSTVDTVLENVAGQVSPALVDVIQLAINAALDKIDMPTNPATKLNPRTKGALLALFNGLADGAEEAMAQVPPPSAAAPKNAIEWAKAEPAAVKKTLTFSKSCFCNPCKCDPCVCGH